MPLTVEEKQQIKYSLGYTATLNGSSLSFGIPRPIETLFLVEQAMTLVPEGGPLANIRRLLQVLANIECKLLDSTTRLAASELDGIKLRPTTQGLSEPDALEREYRRWAGRLADVLGVPFYPYSERFTTTGGTLAGNVPVRRN